MPLYTPEDIAELHEELAAVRRRSQQALLHWTQKNFASIRAKEFTHHGFARRINTLSRCVEVVFEELAPDRLEMPTSAQIKSAEIAAHSSFINVFGSIDNLAWIWVEESGLRRPNGNELSRAQVGLGADCNLVRNSLSEEFRGRLASFDGWFNAMSNFRHALAHRIPPYIPPHIVDPNDAEHYQELSRQEHQALLAGNLERYEEVRQQKQALEFFRPLLTHSFGENSRPVALHAQLIANFNTVHDIGEWMSRELNRIVQN